MMIALRNNSIIYYIFKKYKLSKYLVTYLEAVVIVLLVVFLNVRQ